MKFTPRTAEQVTLSRLLKPGEGNFEITKVNTKDSTKVGPMFVVNLKVWDCNGRQGFITDYVPVDNEKWDWKLRHLCYSAGIGDLYETGELNESQLMDRCGKLKIGIQRDKTGQYPDRNCVLDYVEENKKERTAVSSDAGPLKKELDDDIPF